jgi:hypothetical protein
MTNDELVQKIDWEGGITDAIDYGLRPEDIDDPKVALLWEQARDALKMFQSLATQIENIIGVA